MNRQSQLQNNLLSKRNQQRAFLKRKIAHFEHRTPRDIGTRSEYRRMAALYRDELKRLETA